MSQLDRQLRPISLKGAGIQNSLRSMTYFTFLGGGDLTSYTLLILISSSFPVGTFLSWHPLIIFQQLFLWLNFKPEVKPYMNSSKLNRLNIEHSLKDVLKTSIKNNITWQILMVYGKSLVAACCKFQLRRRLWSF